MKEFSKSPVGSARAGIYIIIFLSALLVIGGAFALYYFTGAKKQTTKDIKAHEKIIGLNFTIKERKMNEYIQIENPYN